MSISLPLHRLGLNASSHAGRSASAVAAARASSWLFKGHPTSASDAILSSIEASPRSSTSKPTYELEITAGPSATEAQRREQREQDIQSLSGSLCTKIDKKGKGRAIDAGDLTHVSPPSNSTYVEEGRIRRPVSTFFDVNASNAAQDLAVSSVASTSSPPAVFTSSFTILEDFMSTRRLPQTPAEARLLVQLISRSRTANRTLSILLEALQAVDVDGTRVVPVEVEVAVLEICIKLPVLSRSSPAWRAWLKEPSKNLLKHPFKLNDLEFYKIWTRLWDLSGERVTTDPATARRVLRRILHYPAPAEFPQAEESRLLKPLRHLLFLAGLETHAKYAVSVLGHLLQYDMFCGKRAKASVERTRLELFAKDGSQAEQAHMQPEISMNDIVLVLQDLLRSSIFSPELVNKYNLSKVLLQATTLPETEFNELLRQTLLRIVLQYNLDCRSAEWVSLVLPHINLFSSTTEDGQQADAKLAFEAVRASMRKFELDLKHVATAANDLRWYLTQIANHHMAIGSQTSTLSRDVRTLTRSYFNTLASTEGLLDGLGTVQLLHVGRLCHEIFSLSPQTDTAQGEVEDIHLSDHIKVLRMLSALRFQNGNVKPNATTASFYQGRPQRMWNDLRVAVETSLYDEKTHQETLLAMTHSLLNTHRAMAGRSGRFTNELANNLLNSLLASMNDSQDITSPAVAGIRIAILKLFSDFTASVGISEKFSLQGRNLRSLCQLSRSVTDVNASEPSTNPAVLTASSIIEHYMDTRKSWVVVPHSDYTALAGALLDNNELEAARAVLQQFLINKEVPTLHDLEIFFAIAQRENPEMSEAAWSLAVKQGLCAKHDDKGRLIPDVEKDHEAEVAYAKEERQVALKAIEERRAGYQATREASRMLAIQEAERAGRVTSES